MSLFRHYKLNEVTGNAIDTSENLVNAVEAGTVSSQTGKINNARGAYSNSNYFSETGTITVLSSTQDHSFSCWAK